MPSILILITIHTARQNCKLPKITLLPTRLSSSWLAEKNGFSAFV